MMSELVLHEAAATGSYQDLQPMLMMGRIDPSFKDEDFGDRTAMHWAASRGDRRRGQPVGFRARRASRKIQPAVNDPASSLKITNSESERRNGAGTFTNETKKKNVRFRTTTLMPSSSTELNKSSGDRLVENEKRHKSVRFQLEEDRYPKISKPKTGQLILVKEYDEGVGREKDRGSGNLPSLPQVPQSLVNSNGEHSSDAKATGLFKKVSSLRLVLSRLGRSSRLDDVSRSPSPVATPATPSSASSASARGMSDLLRVEDWEDVIEGAEDRSSVGLPESVRDSVTSPTPLSPRDLPRNPTPPRSPEELLRTPTPHPACDSYSIVSFSTSCSTGSSADLGDDDDTSDDDTRIITSPSRLPDIPRPPTPDLQLVGTGYALPQRIQRREDRSYVMSRWFGNRGVTQNRGPPGGVQLPKNAAPFLIPDAVAWEYDMADEQESEVGHNKREQRKKQKLHKLKKHRKPKKTKNGDEEPSISSEKPSASRAADDGCPMMFSVPQAVASFAAEYAKANDFDDVLDF